MNTRDAALGQEPLFLMTERGDRAMLRDFSGDQPINQVNILERNFRLINVLDLFSERNELQGLIKIGAARTQGLADGKDDITQSMVEAATRKLPRVTNHLQQEFEAVLGYRPLVEAGEMSSQEARQKQGEEFARFNSAYGRPHKRKERAAYRAKLVSGIVAIEQVEPPVIHEQEPVPMPEAKDRLLAILDDPRAGFMPSTHREKNAILAYLDYLDNHEEYPFGIANQFLEVFTHRQKSSGGRGNILEARRSLISLAYELGDYYENATAQTAALADLQARINDCPNPNVSLQEEVGTSHPGYGALIGYIDTMELLKKGEISGPHNEFSVLHDSEDRPDAEPIPVEVDLDKHKTVEDPYTTQEPDDIVAKRIADKVRTMTIGELRTVVGEARANQEARALFMRSRLEELSVFETEPRFQRFLGQVATTAEQILAKDFISA